MALICLQAQISVSTASAKDGNDVRTIHFPTDKSAGSLLLIPSAAPLGEEAISLASQLGSAKGTVTVTVPAGKLLVLEANRKIFESSATLNQIQPPGSIDALKISFSAIGESEANFCDRALKITPYFKNVSYLDLDQSDVTDSGMANAQRMPNLKSISLVESRVKGAFLKDLSGLPHLSRLKMDRCVPVQSNFVYLAKIPGLKELHFRWMNIDETGVKFISQCNQLESLNLSRNHQINDRAVKYLANLKRLKEIFLGETSVTDAGLESLQNLKTLTFLDLNGTAVSDAGLKYIAGLKNLEKVVLYQTKVTSEGLKALQGLDLKELELPRINYVSEERARLRKIFPHTLLRVHSIASKDAEQIYAPQPN